MQAPFSYAINDEATFNPLYLDPSEGTNNLNLKMGDKITFKVLKSRVNNDKSKIAIENLPGVWVARFGWDCMYYFTQSVQPGDFKPFLPFDAVVHSVMFRRFKDYFKPDGTTASNTNPGFKINEDDWADDGTYYTWSYTVQARMDATKSTYTPIEWKVNKLVGSNPQRDDQRRGLNVAMLNKWNTIFNNTGELTGNFANYDGFDYELGADTDELEYLGQVSKMAKNTLQDNVKITALNEGDDTWKILMPQELPSSEIKYKDNLALSYMVTAYQRNRNSVYGKNRIINLYKGFEIEDIDLIVKDNGANCEGDMDCFYKQDKTSYTNRKLPGQVKITLNNSNTINININSSAPVNSDKGFYGSLQGTSWPATFEKNVPYTYDGLKDLDEAELRKFSMVLESEDGNGFLSKTIYPLSDSNEIGKAKSTGKWTHSFDIPGFGNHNISVTYKRCASCDTIVVAGKEISEVKLRFLAVNTASNQTGYDGARGDGYTWYKQDYYKDYPYAIPKYGYYKGGKRVANVAGGEYLREYTFPKNETVNFTIMDSDPHTFRPPGVEYYKSNRSKAHRIPTDSLGSGSTPGYLKWIIRKVNISDSGISEGSVLSESYGISSQYLFTASGVYSVQALYRGISSVKHIIRIVDYSYTSANDNNQKGEIKLYDLTSDQKKWLGFDTDTPYKLLSVENVLSKFSYIDAGNRDSKTYDKYNNYSDTYDWKSNDTNNNLDNEVFLNKVKNYGGTYSSIEESLKYPLNWYRHLATAYSADTFVAQSNINFVKRETGWEIPYTGSGGVIKGKLDLLSSAVFEPWNITLPWIATTTRHGYQIRANIKCFFSAKDIFDNNHGSFTGRNSPWNNGKGDDINKLSATDYSAAQNMASFDLSDEDKAREAFYHDLVNHRKVIFIPDNWKTRTINVRHLNSTGEFITSMKINADLPAKPVLTASAVNNGNSTLSWQLIDNTTMPVAYFKVYNVTDPDNSIVTLPSDARDFELSGLLCNNTSSSYYVKAFNASGTSNESNTLTIDVQNTIPTIPNNFRSLGATTNTINLAWDASTNCRNEVTYIINYASVNSSGVTKKINSINTSSTNVDVTGLTDGNKYEFQIRASNPNLAWPNSSAHVTLYETTSSVWRMAPTNERKIMLLGEPSFMLYPNPVSGNELKVSAVADKAQYIIRNSLGQVVLKGNVVAGVVSIPTLSSGAYFLEVQSNGQPIVAKFIKN